MDSRKPGIALSLAALILAGALFFILRDDADDGGATAVTTEAPVPADAEGKGATQDGSGQGGLKPAAEPKVATIEVAAGAPVGDVQHLEFDKGGAIRIDVRSDDAGELHLHGYDRYYDLTAGGTTKIAVPATLDGVYELEAHETGELLAEISVNP